MTPEERQMLSGLFDRIRAAGAGPRDQEADAYINDAMRATPAAGYVLAQTVLVQQHALEAAARHIADLEAQARAQPPAPQEGGFLGNIGRSLFGGAAPAQAPRPYDAQAYERDPGYAPQQRPSYAPPPPPPPPQGGPWGGPPPQGGAWGGPPPQGGGFLHGAMQTATGVAGGMLLGNALGGLFGGHGGGLFGGGSSAPTGTVHETVNNYYGGDQAMGDDVVGDDYAAAGDDDYAAASDDDLSDGGGGGGGDDWT